MTVNIAQGFIDMFEGEDVENLLNERFWGYVRLHELDGLSGKERGMNAFIAEDVRQTFDYVCEQIRTHPLTEETESMTTGTFQHALRLGDINRLMATIERSAREYLEKDSIEVGRYMMHKDRTMIARHIEDDAPLAEQFVLGLYWNANKIETVRVLVIPVDVFVAHQLTGLTSYHPYTF